jgi:hypothetical protein
MSGFWISTVLQPYISYGFQKQNTNEKHFKQLKDAVLRENLSYKSLGFLLLMTVLPPNVWDILVAEQPFLGRVAYCYSIKSSLILKVRIMTLGSSAPLDSV